MHMADALISPAVGGTLWAVSGGLIVFCAQRVKQIARDNLVPLMGVLGAFVFAAQMINFSIPGTGSSGHLGGGLLLALLLGPSAALLVIASVLTVQALFFADGGLLALGCNIFNLGFIPAFIAYPLIYRTLAGTQQGTVRNKWATVVAAIAGLQLGALGVVLETVLSRNSELPFASFATLMLPIHFAIGIAEGLITVAVVAVIIRTRPEILCTTPAAVQPNRMRPLLIGLAITALILGGSARWIASTHPDGLEWSIAHVTGDKELSQPKTEARPTPNTGDSRPGVAGGLLILALASLVGITLRLYSNRIDHLKK
jgi:cobalt/nickel transport system permease protein